MSAVLGLWLARLLPYRALGAPGAQALVERNVLAWRHAWVALLGGVVEPIVFLVAMGVGLGGLVGQVDGPGGVPVDYAAFVAPALLATAAMNAPVYESFNVYDKLRESRLYDAILATPVTSREIAVGEVGWALARSGLYGTGFLAMAVAAGLIRSWWGLLALPAAMLVGFAFGGLTIAAITYVRSWRDFDLVFLAVIPMFLLSTTFFPVEVYPPTMRWLVLASPLYHGIALVRGLTLGAVGPALLGHATVLVVLGLLGMRWADRRIARLLLP